MMRVECDLTLRSRNRIETMWFPSSTGFSLIQKSNLPYAEWYGGHMQQNVSMNQAHADTLYSQTLSVLELPTLRVQ